MDNTCADIVFQKDEINEVNIMADTNEIIETLQKALDNAEIDGMIYAEVRRPVVFDIINLIKQQQEELEKYHCFIASIAGYLPKYK